MDFEVITPTRNGSNARERQIKIKPGFACFSTQAALLIAPRLMDFTRGGILYVYDCSLFNKPIAVIYKSEGAEPVETRAGIFSCLKVNFQLADPLVGKVLKPLTDLAVLWVEDSPAAYLVKIKGPSSYVLEEIIDL